MPSKEFVRQFVRDAFRLGDRKRSRASTGNPFADALAEQNQDIREVKVEQLSEQAQAGAFLRGGR